MAQRESRKSRQIMDALRAEGWFCFKVHGGAMMMAGLPDIIVCAEGLFIGLETKHGETREGTSATQDLRRDQIRNAGGIYQVATTPAEAVAVVRRVLDSSGAARS
jgi:Holliday junction resolvase